MNSTLLLSLAPQADTVVTVAARDAYDLVVGAAAASFALVFLVVLVGLLVTFVRIQRTFNAVGEFKDRISVDPAVQSLRKTAAHGEAIAEVLRGEVEELSASVGRLSDRLTQASDRMEERIEEFNALMEVMQEEAENAFVDTAATARGVRHGLGELQSGKRRGRRAAPRHSENEGDPQVPVPGAIPAHGPGAHEPGATPAHEPKEG